MERSVSQPTWAWGTPRGKLLGTSQSFQRMAMKLSMQPRSQFSVQVSIDGGPLVHLWAGTGRSFQEYTSAEGRWVKKAKDVSALRRAGWQWEDVYSTGVKRSRRFSDMAVDLVVDRPEKYFNVYVYIDDEKDPKRVWSGQGRKLREILKERPDTAVEWVKNSR